jgi:hypothetical protein
VKGSMTIAVFATDFELRGMDVAFFSCVEKMGGNYFLKNVLLLKFDGL